MDEQILVTGATGFIATQTILDLLEAGYRVRGTVRSLDKAVVLRDVLRAHTPLADTLECVEADLSRDAGWAEAVSGCSKVLHIASPFPEVLPKNHDDLIRPARDGALRVLRAARNEGVQRVVMTSSVAAIAYGWGKSRPEILTEEHWSNPDNLKDNNAYTRSKTIAERAAWDFVTSPEGEGLELTTINPAAVLGPALSADTSSSLQIISQLFGGNVPALPKLSFSIVDVRDVARAHHIAMNSAEASGKRFLLADRCLWFTEIADIIRDAFPDRAGGIPKGSLPSIAVQMIARLNPPLKAILPELGKFRALSNEQMRSVLGIEPISAQEAIVASVQSLIDMELI
jgi:nucleoside-diphosphate-sugar epimerase